MPKDPEINPDVTEAEATSPNAPAPTFHVLHQSHGGGYTASDVYPKDGDRISPIVVFAGVRQVFDPRITNVSAVDIYVRRPGEPWPQVPTMTRYTLNKADTVNVVKNGRELQLYCGTHATGNGVLDEFGARDYWCEKDQIPDFFPEEAPPQE